MIKQFYPDPNNTVQSSKINRSQQTIIPANKAKNKLEEIHRKEVEQLARLKHPQIPMLITHFEQDNYSYLVQEFIEGTNLQVELERQGAFSESQIWQVLNEILPVIKYIHGQNIIHRDIKPENIIRPVKNKKLVLVDFGAAKLVAPKSHNQNTKNTQRTIATAIGTPDYMAPEQQNGREVFASDLYSLGVTCISLLTNKYPHELFDDGTHAWQWFNYCPKVSKKLKRVLNKLIELGTSNRYTSADEVIEDIKSAKSKEKNQNPFNSLTTWEKLGTVAAGITAVITLAINLVGFQPNKNSTQELSKVHLATVQNINYKKLLDFLRVKDWQSADQETYKILLELAGEKAQSRGYINLDTLSKLSCTDLKTLDELWRTASDGKLGFSSQQRIYEQEGLDWKKMYITIGWGEMSNGQFEETIDDQFNWKTRKREWMPEKQPNFTNPPPGHLPITKGLIRGKAFPQFAEICGF